MHKNVKNKPLIVLQMNKFWKWRPSSLSELNLIISYMELIHLGSEATKYSIIKCSKSLDLLVLIKITNVDFSLHLLPPQ